MTRSRLLLTTLMFLGAASLAAAQARPAPPAPSVPPARPELQAAPAPPTSPAPPKAPVPPAAPKHPGQLLNVKIDFTITEQRPDGTPTKRAVSLIVGDGEGGSVRSEPDAFQTPGGLQLNVDARPEVAGTSKIRLQFSLQYSGPAQATVSAETPRGTVIKNNLRQTMSLVLDDGKPLVVAQSADPTSDRTVTLEVKATILR